MAAGMNFPWANAILAVAMAYVAVGAVVALAFLLFGLDRTDPAARGAYGFRALIGPGLALLWPLVAYRWLASPANDDGQAPARQANAHRVAWLCLAVIVPVILLAGFLQRRTTIPTPPAQRLSALEVRP
jgi:hypothetical protein